MHPDLKRLMALLGMLLATLAVVTLVLTWITVMASRKGKELRHAAGPGRVAELRALLDKGYPPDAPDYTAIDQTALMGAIANENIEGVKLLLQRGADPRRRTMLGIGPLFLAVSREGRYPLLDLLLEKGGDPNEISMFGVTVLHQAAKLDEKYVERLLQAGAKLESTDWLGRTPLFYAVVHGNATTISLLLDRGANIEHRERQGFTPLLEAVTRRPEVTVLLLKRGADVYARSKAGLTAREIADRKGLTALKAILESASPREKASIKR